MINRASSKFHLSASPVSTSLSDSPGRAARRAEIRAEVEAAAIAATGIRHILILTGEAPAQTPMSYLEEAVKIMKKHFSSIALEIFPMDVEEYQVLCQAGADSLTVYQEVYDRDIYKEVHPKGRKADYK